MATNSPIVRSTGFPLDEDQDTVMVELGFKVSKIR
ncbi:hypothetical protein Sinac_2485 [Singulisphaera acidiphila DSM 18658]|uniref:Uncharacterized protein n=1 Tax=Singulisphaera acidiphila (strain ATCC BAA-1392 / DSM 18658 / VKM B-2454 / MOB10) TaxID=886293 RepID=L0DBP3_SINAD|nr:hypothetical protein Sinac_2485 [Singulisphaera acidiphila DSM 18658]